jgi:hypothetical protein
LSITTAAPSVVSPPKFAEFDGSFGIIACVVLLGVSRRAPYRGVSLSLFTLALLMFATSCGGSGSGGTPKGSYTVKVTGTDGSQGHTTAVSVSVE